MSTEPSLLDTITADMLSGSGFDLAVDNSVQVERILLEDGTL